MQAKILPGLCEEEELNSITYLHSSMANKRGDRPFVTINLKVSDEEYSKLKERKDKETWESYFLRLAGI